MNEQNREIPEDHTLISLDRLEELERKEAALEKIKKQTGPITTKHGE